MRKATLIILLILLVVVPIWIVLWYIDGSLDLEYLFVAAAMIVSIPIVISRNRIRN